MPRKRLFGGSFLRTDSTHALVLCSKTCLILPAGVHGAALLNLPFRAAMTQLSEALRSSSSSSSGGDGPSEPEVSAGLLASAPAGNSARWPSSPPSTICTAVRDLRAPADRSVAHGLSALAPAPPVSLGPRPPPLLSCRLCSSCTRIWRAWRPISRAGCAPPSMASTSPAWAVPRALGHACSAVMCPRQAGFGALGAVGLRGARATKRCSRYWIQRVGAFATPSLPTSVSVAFPL